MIKINKIEEYIIKSGKKIDANILKSFNSFIKISNTELENESPVDKGDFKKLWDALSIKKTQSLLSSKIENSSAYASAIEYGSTPGSKPWPNPGEKTVMSEGKIYSTQAVGGVIGKVFNDNKVNAFVEDLAISIIKAFK